MPPCNKELKIYSDGNNQSVVALIVKCCDSLGHEGSCEWHLWTDGENRATGKKGIIKVIK